IFPEDPRIGTAFVHELRLANDGLVYGVDNSGSVFTIFDGSIVNYISYADSNVKGVSCIYPDPLRSGYVYIDSENEGTYLASMAENFSDLQKIDIAPLSQVQAFEYIDGRLWICTRNGIGVMIDGNFLQLPKAPMDNSVGHVISDYEGNLWFTSTRQGVMKIVPNRFSDVFDYYGLPETVVNSTCMYGNQLFVATDTGLIVLDENGPVNDVPLKKAETASGISLNSKNLVELLEGCRIRSIIRDSKGRLWISTWRNPCGLLRYDNGEAIAFTTAEGLFSDHIRTVYECQNGSMLVANTGGVCVIEGNKVTAAYGEEQGIVNTEILTVAEGKNGDIIAGSDGGGIYILNKDGCQHIGYDEGIKSGAVMRIKHDSKRDIYWVVTGNSIAFLSHDYQLHTITNFPYSNNFDLYENKKGEMWILSSNGIHVVPVSVLLGNGEIIPTHYGISSGLPCISTANSYSELTSGGELYLAGNTGVVKVNIDEAQEKVTDLKMSVPYIDADGVRIYPEEDGSFRVSSAVRKLTIYSFVYNYSLTNPQVTYSLEGFDKSETTVARNELGPVDYTNLPGGTYQFVMKVSNLYEPENKKISVTITKEKAIHEHTEFYIVAAILTAFILGFFIRQYINYRIQAVEQKHKEDAQKASMLTEMKTAARIQSSMLPQDFPPFPDRTEFELYASMDPAREVGGDFYDFYLIDDDHLCLTIADVSGKGIPGALVMMISRILLKNNTLTNPDLAEVLRKTNESFCANQMLQMFVTVWMGILEISTGKIIAANAGHEYPAVMKNGEFSLLKDKHGLVIGGMSGMKYTEYEIQLEPGDKLFVYTDGVPESMNMKEELFGTERMLRALNTDPSVKPQELLETVTGAIDRFVGDAEQFDDVTMLCIEYKGKQE
ncbi:MAG: SpoIIE family protein phosphatase, partial [Erysipelotrichaceae bacterium]|nr:SpoIIE family protein phosphatase [Erysipelotrichaceae bacterium]